MHFDGDVKAVNQGTDIQVDGQVAGYMEEGSTMQMDFMDKMAMYLYLFSDFNSEHLD